MYMEITKDIVVTSLDAKVIELLKEVCSTPKYDCCLRNMTDLLLDFQAYLYSEAFENDILKAESERLEHEKESL